MACVNCQKIRSAILHGKMAEAAGLTVETLREKIGWKSDDVSESTAIVVVEDQDADGEPAKAARAR